MAMDRRQLSLATSGLPAHDRPPATVSPPEEPGDLTQPSAASVGSGSGLACGERRSDWERFDRHQRPAAIDGVVADVQHEPVARQMRPARHVRTFPEVSISVEDVRLVVDPPECLAEVKELIHLTAESHRGFNSEVIRG
jgi:hypothetical protein